MTGTGWPALRAVRLIAATARSLHGLVGEWPAEPDADVEDDAGSDEAESRGGEPLVGSGPCPADAAGVALVGLG